ncbi:putative calcium-binding protein CML44 [Senna tora]|uniref:Putative calcium-binding protein CML44 n=1 Tax=Senna tora TaxID=362788 RepID=A0A834T6L3_9FABA|nr:putative calcium-binding protein CML44 [Senna tora]
MYPMTLTDLQRIFEKLDVNEDGLVSLEELNWLLEKIGFQFSEEELECLVGKQSLDLNDFLFFYESISKQNKDDVERDLVEAFKVFDLDGDGFITSQELECVLKRLGLWDDKTGKDCRSMICFYDTNSDGRLDFEEFKGMMHPTTTS